MLLSYSVTTLLLHITSERKKEGVMVRTFPALLTLYEADSTEEGEASDGGFHDGLHISPGGRNIL